MSTKTPITLVNGNGKQLVGILHEAEARAPHRGAMIVLLSPGIKNRVAPHRLYIHMAERFTALGYPVFRFDPEGIGDSEGEIVEKMTADVLGSVEFGRFVSSTLDVLSWLQREKGVSRFIVGGLCGGAITGLLAAAREEKIVGLLGLGIPAISSALTLTDPYKYISRGQLQGLKQGYLRNLFSLKRWWRLLTFQSDYRMIAKVVFSGIQAKQKEEPGEQAGKPEQQVQSNLNPLFVDSMFKALASGCRMCLVFSEVDRLYWDFQEKFLGLHQDRMAGYADRHEIHVVGEANHIFSFPEWEEDMLEKACSWLQGNALNG